jgi:hypothetical protein
MGAGAAAPGTRRREARVFAGDGGHVDINHDFEDNDGMPSATDYALTLVEELDAHVGPALGGTGAADDDNDDAVWAEAQRLLDSSMSLGSESSGGLYSPRGRLGGMWASRQGDAHHSDMSSVASSVQSLVS